MNVSTSSFEIAQSVVFDTFHDTSKVILTRISKCSNSFKKFLQFCGLQSSGNEKVRDFGEIVTICEEKGHLKMV